jgi:1-acyl-sn-glycerol-3-phosphate acyltransferase
MTHIRSAVAWVLMWITLAIMAPPFVLGCLIDKGGVHMYWMQVLYLRLAAFYIGMKVRVTGAENIPRPGQTVVFMSNHRSFFDISAIQFAIWPHQVRFVAKRELAKIPFLGAAIRYGGHILIARDNRDSAIKTLMNFAGRYSGKFSIVVFPEGTRSPGNHLLRFKRGGFHLARELKLPIVPVSISGSQRILDRHGLTLRAGTVTVHFGTPIDPEGIPGNDALIALVRERIEAGLLDYEPERAASVR